jgi:hypothetical protein
MRFSLLALGLVALLAITHPTAALAGKKKGSTEHLMSVITPGHKGLTSAHPWINLRVRFGQASNGTPADLTTFTARLGRCKLRNDIFEDVIENGVIVEKRARLTDEIIRKCKLKFSDKPKNKLTLQVRAASGGKGKSKLRDKDKVRFGIRAAENSPPVALIATSPAIIGDACQSAEGLIVSFTAQEQPDADADLPIRYLWDFGDGATATGHTVSHAYRTCAPMTVQLRSYDEEPENGGKEGFDQRILPALPVLDAGREAGILQLCAGVWDDDNDRCTAQPPTPLEIGAVPPGQVGTTTFTVRNTDRDAVSQIKFTISSLDENSPFSTDCPPTAPACALGPGGGRDITVTYAPTQPGHAQATLELLAAAENRSLLRMIVHGYAGAGPVPWETSGTGFYVGRFDTVLATLPDGTVQTMDTGTGLCEGGSLDGSPCITNADCSGSTNCGSRVCLGGENHLSPCSGPNHCPDGTCGATFEPIDICSDANGSVYMLNPEERFDSNDDGDPPESGMIWRAGIDGSRSMVTTQVTEDSPAIGCQPGSGGRIFWANYELEETTTVDDKESLRSIPRTGGSSTQEIDNITARMGDADPEHYIDPDDGFITYEESTAIRVAADGKSQYIANFFGLYRVSPKPALVLSFDVSEAFDLFPDGSILATSVTEDDSESIVRVYKFDPERAATGALSLSDLAPWSTLVIPNNRGPCGEPCRRSTFIVGQAVAPDGVVFVNLFTIGGDTDLPINLRVRGTARFVPEGDGSSGVSTGFVDLDIHDGLIF